MDRWACSLRSDRAGRGVGSPVTKPKPRVAPRLPRLEVPAPAEIAAAEVSATHIPAAVVAAAEIAAAVVVAAVSAEVSSAEVVPAIAVSRVPIAVAVPVDEDRR